MDTTIMASTVKASASSVHPIISDRSTNFVLSKTHSAHFSGSNELQATATDPAKQSAFGNLLLQSIDSVSDLVNQEETLKYQALVNPESVNEHEIVIASEKATLAVSITNSIVERALEAYRAIISLR